MTITGGSALPKDDIEQMISDAEAHAEEDRKRREQIELRNQADTLVYTTDKTLTEHGEKVDEATRARIEEALGDLKKALEADDSDAIRSAMEKVGSQSQELAQAIYAASQEPTADTGGAAGGAEDHSADDEVVDAEIVDEGDEEQQAG